MWIVPFRYTILFITWTLAKTIIWIRAFITNSSCRWNWCLRNGKAIILQDGIKTAVTSIRCWKYQTAAMEIWYFMQNGQSRSLLPWTFSCILMVPVHLPGRRKKSWQIWTTGFWKIFIFQVCRIQGSKTISPEKYSVLTSVRRDCVCQKNISLSHLTAPEAAAITGVCMCLTAIPENIWWHFPWKKEAI